MPSAVQRVLTALLLVAAVVGLEFSFEYIIPDAAWRQLALLAMVNVIAALSLNIINGMAGQFSIGHAGFLGIGAYTGAVVAGNLHQMLGGGDTPFERSFIVMPVVLLSAGLVAAVFGFVVGLPSLRLRGDYLAIVTLGFGEIVRLLADNLTEITGGGRGLAQVAYPRFGVTEEFPFLVTRLANFYER